MPESTLTAPLGQSDDTSVSRAQEELRRRFARSGCMARPGEYALTLRGLALDSVEEALHRLWQEDQVEMNCLPDGSLIFFFPRA